jgi:hypothetical protein
MPLEEIAVRPDLAGHLGSGQLPRSMPYLQPSRRRRLSDAGHAHRAAWIKDAHVTELPGPLSEGPGGDYVSCASSP